MSDDHGVSILMIYHREPVIPSNLVVICECQDIDVVEEFLRSWTIKWTK